MAIDSRQKRMSAMNHGSPWRGPLVDATEVGFGVGNRAAACWLYSGIAVSAPRGNLLCGTVSITLRLTGELTITGRLTGTAGTNEEC